MTDDMFVKDIETKINYFKIIIYTQPNIPDLKANLKRSKFQPLIAIAKGPLFHSKCRHNRDGTIMVTIFLGFCLRKESIPFL